MKAGRFPLQRQTGGNLVVWLESEVLDWMRRAGRPG